MTLKFFHVDVFAEASFLGNPLAVFPDATDLSGAQMQEIARELNLSETTFVTAVRAGTYEVRIFTPGEELPFAGHPTIGTAWVLLDLGRLSGEQIVQHSAAGETNVRVHGDILWFERAGTADGDLEVTSPQFEGKTAKALGLEPEMVGLEARELGRPGLLRPAFSDAGLRLLMVPLRDLPALEACRPSAVLLEELTTTGVYCFTAVQAGRIRARGFFPGLGIQEDPATGSAAAALGIFIADRVGEIEFEIAQGVEMSRPSRMRVRARPGQVSVGGRVAPIYAGELTALP